LGDPKTAEMVGTVAGQTAVGGASGTIEQARKWGLTPQQLAFLRASGYNYVGDRFEGILHKSVRRPDGRVQVIDVNTSLISGNLKRAESKTREQLFSKIQEAFKSKNFEEAWRLFQEYRHVLSKEHVEKLEQLGNHIFYTKAGDTETKADRKANKEETSETKKGGVTFSGGVGDAAGGVNLGINVAGGYQLEKRVSRSKEDITENKTDDSAIQEFKYLLATAITDSVKNLDSNTTGNLYDKLFKEQHTKQEATKLTEQYKELTTLENSLSINTLPLLIQHRGDRLLAEHPDKYALHGLNNAYDEAVRQLIEAIHSGDSQKIKEILNEIKTIQSIYSPSLGGDIVKREEELKQEVKEELQKKEEMINQQGQKIKDGVGQPLLPYKLPEAEKLLDQIKRLSQLPPSFIETYIRGKGMFGPSTYFNFNFANQPTTMGGGMSTARSQPMQLDPRAYNIPLTPIQYAPNKEIIISPIQTRPYYLNEKFPPISGPSFERKSKVKN
jgi:hypothetical protein